MSVISHAPRVAFGIATVVRISVGERLGAGVDGGAAIEASVAAIGPESSVGGAAVPPPYAERATAASKPTMGQSNALCLEGMADS